MDTIELKDFADGPLLREATFFEKVAAHDWQRYAGHTVLLRGCSDILIPTWAFMVVVARLVPVADRIFFGEPKSRIPIWQRPKAEAAAAAADAAATTSP